MTLLEIGDEAAEYWAKRQVLDAWCSLSLEQIRFILFWVVIDELEAGLTLAEAPCIGP